MSSEKAILSVDLEAYFQAEPMRRLIPRRFWPRFDLRAEQSAGRVLDLLDRHRAKATFFASGWMAETAPHLLAEIVRRGHDVACLGYPSDQTEPGLMGFRDGLLRSCEAIERATGQKVRGYRSATGQVPDDEAAYLQVLAHEGILFESSRNAAERTRAADPASITRIPASAPAILGFRVPLAGTDAIRLMPDRVFAATSFASGGGSVPHVTFRTWELDPEQPRFSALGRRETTRQYKNLDRMADRLEVVLAKHRFQSIASHLGFAPQQVTTVRPATPVVTSASPTGAAQNVTIVVPCFNEEETLPYLAGNLASLEASTAGTYRFSYVFVDDGSSDDTWGVLNSLFGDKPNCQVVQHTKNRGIAAATMTGIRLAKDEVVCGIDCDCSFDPHDLVRMIPLLRPGIDLVQASPYHKDGGVMNVPAWRLVLSQGCCNIYRRILNHKFSSYTACFRVYRRAAIAPIEIEDGGFLGIMEMFVKLDQRGARMVEFPAVLATRLLGVSKMKTLRVIRSHLRLMARTALGSKAAGNPAPTGRPVTR